MSSLLSTVTGTADESATNQGDDRAREPTSDSGGGSRRRNLALAAAGLGAAYVLRRRRAGKRTEDSQASGDATTGELDTSTSTDESSSGKQRRGIGSRLVRTVAGIAASVLVRRAIRRWRKR